MIWLMALLACGAQEDGPGATVGTPFEPAALALVDVGDGLEDLKLALPDDQLAATGADDFHAWRVRDPHVVVWCFAYPDAGTAQASLPTVREALVDLAKERDALRADLVCLVGAGAPDTPQEAVDRVASALSR